MNDRITVADIEHITFKTARETLTLNEPIPEFSTRRPHILESCIAAPFQTYGGKYLYPGFISRAAMLFYLMIKDHPFENGNKRVAMVTLFTFLHGHGKWLTVDGSELFDFTMWVAQSLPRYKEEVVRAIEKFIRAHIEKR
jgi:death on curing protein